jgi:membrane protease YdiL (CAAX protease family)
MFFRISVFYVSTWFFLILLGGFQQETGLLPPEIGLAQWGPGVAALLMLLIFRKDGHKIVFFSKDTPFPYYLYAALIPAGVSLVVFLLRMWLPIQAGNLPAVYDSLLLVILWAPIGALGEEIGWRGYLHKKLEPRMRGLFSSLLVGLLWMPIHIHFFAKGLVFVLFFTLLIISYSIVIYALMHDTNFNTLLATIFHLSINLSNLIFLDVIYETAFMMINGLVWVVVAAVTVFMRRDIFLVSRS